jgi:NAD(P)-dependent dehydrogenase (short-subunit alcohol dehydrogenase family)
MITQAHVDAEPKIRRRGALGGNHHWPALQPPDSSSEIADLAVFLASPRGVYVNGTVVDVDGGGMWRG